MVFKRLFEVLFGFLFLFVRYLGVFGVFFFLFALRILSCRSLCYVGRHGAALFCFVCACVAYIILFNYSWPVLSMKRMRLSAASVVIWWCECFDQVHDVFRS